MLDQLPVLMQYPYTINCQKCSTILFDIKIIDQFVRYRPPTIAHNTAIITDPSSTNFYLLHPTLHPTSLHIQKIPYISKQQPFHMLFLSNIKCSQCNQNIGIKLLSVSSEFRNHQLLGRLLIYCDKVRVKTIKEDVTEQVLEKFSEDWTEEQGNDDQNGQRWGQSQMKIVEKGYKSNYNQNFTMHNKQFQSASRLPQTSTKPHTKATESNIKSHQNYKQTQKLRSNEAQQQQKEKEKQKQKSIQAYQKNYLRNRLLQQPPQSSNSQTKQIIKQIVGSIQFFSDILINLEKRIAQSENVCNLMKKKVQEIAPLLRKRDNY